MVTVPDFRLPAVQLSGLNTAVYWLREHGVTAKRLAELLNTNVGHIRVLKHRGKRPLLFYFASSLSSIKDRPIEDIRKRLHVRLEKDSVGHSGRQRKRIEDLGAQIESIWTRCGRSGEFMAGLLALQPYDGQYGRPASALWFRFMARLHQIRAWFRVHGGMSTSAYQEAKIAIDLSHLAYKEKEDPLDLRRLTESCLIASNACLLAANPKASLKLLDIASQASKEISDPLGSEHYRQRGTALFQLREDEEARKYLVKARVAMEKKQEVEKMAQLAMVDGQAALFGKPDLDTATDVLEQVRRDFAWSSMEHAMTLNRAAACALMTDSSDLHQLAQGYLRQILAFAQPYGHEATTAELLALTPELRLDRRFWNAWIRHALYENAYKTR